MQAPTSTSHHQLSVTTLTHNWDQMKRMMVSTERIPQSTTKTPDITQTLQRSQVARHQSNTLVRRQLNQLTTAQLPQSLQCHQTSSIRADSSRLNKQDIKRPCNSKDTKNLLSLSSSHIISHTEHPHKTTINTKTKQETIQRSPNLTLTRDLTL